MSQAEHGHATAAIPQDDDRGPESRTGSRPAPGHYWRRYTRWSSIGSPEIGHSLKIRRTPFLWG